MVAGALGADGSWESVCINIGSALALVVVLVLVEDAWRSDVDRRIELVQRDAHEARAIAMSVAEAQTLQRTVRSTSDASRIDGWCEDPGPASLWVIRQRCEALNLSVPEQVIIANVAITFYPASESSIQLTVNPVVPASGASGSDQLDWSIDASLPDVIAWVEEAMAKLKIHPGSAFEMSDVVRRVGDQYSARIAAAFTGP